VTEQWRTAIAPVGLRYQDPIDGHPSQANPTTDLLVRLRHGQTDYRSILQVPVVHECSFDLPEQEM
jgi:hypothetical protein